MNSCKSFCFKNIQLKIVIKENVENFQVMLSDKVF